MKFISLLRGINVSGQKIIKMAELKLLFENLNFKNIETYIQSGNIVFDSEITDSNIIKDIIEQSIFKNYAFTVPAIIINSLKLKNLQQHNPFLTKRKEDIEKLYVTFLDKIPQAKNIDELSKSETTLDEFIIKEDIIYIFCPNGYGKTKYTNTFFENKLRVRATTRNWKTVKKLIALSE